MPSMDVPLYSEDVGIFKGHILNSAYHTLALKTVSIY